MNFREMNIKKLMNSIFIILITFSVLSTIVMLNMLNNSENMGANIPLIIVILLNLAVIIVFALSSSYVIRKRVLRPLEELESDMKEISQGKLSTKIRHESDDEFGGFADNFRTLMAVISEYISGIDRLASQMAGGDFEIQFKKESIGDFKAIDNAFMILSSSLSQTIYQINESFSQVSAGSDQVASGAQSLSQGAAEQASSIEQLSAAIIEISDQVNHNAGNADVANQKVANLGQEIQKSNSQMEEMLTAMSEINQKSGEIGKIIKAIEDIAFQTNILALNAAVEAARAGSAGKGFAVVADEVRNLANKSAEAAKNTTVLIEGSIKAVDNGTRIANETAKVLGNIETESKEIVENVDQISQKSQEQATSIKQITQGIDQIAAVIQMNSATSEESAAASEELSSQAHVMREILRKFKYSKSAIGNKAHPETRNSSKVERPEKKEAVQPKRETVNNSRPPRTVKQAVAIPAEKSQKPAIEKREVKQTPQARTNVVFNSDKY